MDTSQGKGFMANLYVQYLLYIHNHMSAGLAWYHTTPVPSEYLKAKFKDPHYKVHLYQKRIPSLPKVKLRLRDERFIPYTYNALPTPRHIRLLILDAGSGDDPISFQLVVHDLRNSRPYEALSYTWGDSRDTVLVQCHGKHLKLRRNLYSALWYLRSKENQRIMWVDGICINQEDLSERSSQVLLMQDIYRGASSTIVWLGNETKQSAKGFEYVAKLAEFVLSLEDSTTDHVPLTAQDLEGSELPAANSKDWQALDDIFWRAWYFRVWIIQEISVSRSAVVHCGTQSIPWHDLSQVARYVQARYFQSITGVQAEGVTSLDEIAGAYSVGLERSLHQLLIESRSSLASDPRDHVYAILALASDGISKAIIPDYTLDHVDLYTSVTAQIIQEEKTLDVLSNLVDSRILLGKRGTLPSWVPNWSISARTTPLLQLPNTSYSATGTSEAQVRFSSSKLFSHGCVIDRIKLVGNTFNIDQHRHSFIRKLEKVPVLQLPDTNFGRCMADMLLGICVLLGEKFTSNMSVYPTGESTVEALCNVLVASQEMSADGTPSILEAYRSFRYYYVDPMLELKFSQVSVLEDKGHDREAGLAYKQAHERVADWRRLGISEKGYLGLFPLSCRKGDEIVLLSGGKTPFLVRKERNSTHILLGDCYVHGYMNGEMWDPDVTLQEYEFV